MEKNELIKELLSELSYRSKEGYPKLDNREQISILAEILDEWGYTEIKNELIENLLEADDKKFTATKKDTNQTVAFDSEEARDAAIEKGTHTKKEDSEEDDSKEKPKTAVSPGTSSGDSYNDSLSDNDPAKIKKSKTSKVKKSPNVTNKIYGKSGEGDTDVKNDMMKYGFSGYQKGTGKKPAPGSAGSAFNEIASGEAVHMIGENPNINEEELARKMYEEYKETELGKEQSKSSGVGKIPKDIENEKLYSKCVISARSARTKYNTTQNRVNNLQSNGKFGTIDKIDTYYGAADSITAQTISINDANKVLLPNGTEVSKEDAVKFVEAGGGGMNPSDTATFVKDKSGNLLIQFHSDKTSTADIQDNSTLAQEGENYKDALNRIDEISDDDKKEANSIIDTYSSKMSSIEENYNNQAATIAGRLSELTLDTQIDIIEKDKQTLKKNIEVAIFGKDGKPKKQFRNYLPADSTTTSLSMKEKYESIRRMVADGNGKTNEVKVITKVGLILQSKDSSIEGIDVKKLISDERAEVVNLQRERVNVLNKKSVDVGGVSVPLGRLMEAEETIRGFHLSLIDYPPKKYESGNPSSMVGSSLDINMGGVKVNGEVLRGCMGVSNTTEFKQKFKLIEAEDLVKDGEGNVTGKTVFVYAIDSEGKEIQIGKKSYRSKAGATGKTNNTFIYSNEMQKCFKSKS
tara:strand:+ start:396 stop:2465 length:2070 start_codon:yes stop_codon:yes gene_type:complete